MERAYANTAVGQIHYIFEGVGDPIILLHHAGASAKEFATVIPLLSPKWRVLAMDLPGHGGSDPFPEPPLIQDYAKTVVAFMDALGIEEAHLVGLHTGAQTSLKTAFLYPERVKSIVLYGVVCRGQRSLDELLPPHAITVHEVKEDGSHLLDAWGWQQMFAKASTPPERIHHHVTERLIAWESEPMSHRACYFHNGEIRQEMPSIACPTLIINGSLDPLRDDSVECHKHIAGSQYFEIENGDVHVTLEFPTEFSDGIARFIEPFR